MDLQDIFIYNIKRLRREKNITQEQLAERCETDTAYIGQIETKKRFPSIKFIEKIAASLEVDSYILFSVNDTNDRHIDVDNLVEKIKTALLPEIKKEIKSALKAKR